MTPSASSKIPIATSGSSLLRYSLWPAARPIWQAGDAVAFDDLKWIDGKLTAKDAEPLSFARLAKHCHAFGLTTGVMVHASNRWQWAKAEFAMGGETWSSPIRS